MRKGERLCSDIRSTVKVTPSLGPKAFVPGISGLSSLPFPPVAACLILCAAPSTLQTLVLDRSGAGPGAGPDLAI